MTTIAYHKGIIAFDSRITQGFRILTDNENKKYTMGGVHFFLTGQLNDYREFMNSYLGDLKILPNNNAAALIVDNGKVLRAGANGSQSIWVLPVEYSVAIGSGAEHAITAIDMGASAKQAVQMAAKRDSSTGGRIRTFRVPTN